MLKTERNPEEEKKYIGEREKYLEATILSVRQLLAKLQEEKSCIQERENLILREEPARKRKKLPQNSSSESVSDLSKKPLSPRIHKDFPAYFHWFSLQLYNLYHSAQHRAAGDCSDVRLRFLNEDFYIKRSRLNMCVKNILKAREVHDRVNTPGEVVGIMSDPDICQAEITYTSLYARALDRFLFNGSECDQGAVLHQFPSCIKKLKTSIERMDVAVVSMPSLTPLLCPEIKKVDSYLQAVTGTALYAVNCVSVQEPIDKPCWPLVLGVPSTPKLVSLQCYVPVDGALWRSEIVECEPENVQFLCTLYAGVKYLIKHQIVLFEPIECFQPIFGKKFQVVEQSKPRVLRYEGDLCKVYDNRDKHARQHNHELLEKLQMPHRVHNLSDVGRFTLLTRPYVEGNHRPNKLSDFIDAVKCLKKVNMGTFMEISEFKI